MKFPFVKSLRIASLLLPTLFSSILNAQVPPPPAAPPTLILGTAWYPEQWPESRWDADLDLMQKAGINMVRVGEFAWSRMEPSDTHYDLDWLDRAVSAAARHNIYTVIGTPSAAPPAWLTQKYPETLRTREDGRKDEHGNRQHFDFANPKYRQLSRSMAEQLAKRFGHNPWVLGWQIDNEYANADFGPATRVQFQQWLKVRYQTLDNLNARWTTSYWSETYQSWDQVPIETKYGNPGLLLSWMRFVSDTWRSYQKNQLDVIRANALPAQFITTNMMGWFDGYDHYTVSQDLDLATWDDYVGQGQLDRYRNGAAHDLTRGFLRKNFWVMETQPGFVNWQKINNSLDKSEVRAMAWHDIGHGADAVSYWQWRSALNGQEEYHGTLVGADGTPVPLYAEVAELGAEFLKAAPALKGTSPKSDVAILHSYDSRWAVNWQRHNANYDPIDELVSYYQPLRDLSQSIDIVNPSAPLNRYKLVVAPGLNVLSDAEAQNLIDYVQQGGNLVLGQRTAMKNVDNGLQPERQPGPLVDLLGGRVEQYYALTAPVPVTGEWTKAGTASPSKTTATKSSTMRPAATSKEWAELLSTKNPETKVLLRYGKSNGWLDNQPAVITRKVGKGSITYIGAWLDPATMTNAAKWMIATAGIQPKLGPVPAGIDVYPREGPNGTVYILVNFAPTPQTVTLPTPMHDILKGNAAKSITLPTYGVSVLSKP